MSQTTFSFTYTLMVDIVDCSVVVCVMGVGMRRPKMHEVWKYITENSVFRTKYK